MATDKELLFIAQTLHHLLTADAYLYRVIKSLRAFVDQDTNYVDKELSKIDCNITDDEFDIDVKRIYYKLKRQWKDSRSMARHDMNNVGCECPLCLIEKLKEYALLKRKKV